MPYCSECGAEVAEGYMFCPDCGRDLSEQADPPGGQVGGTDDEVWGKASDDGDGPIAELGDDPATERTETVERAESTERTEPIPTASADDAGGDATDVERTTNVDGPSPFTDGALSHALGYATKRSNDPVVIGGIIEFAGMIVPFVNLMVRGFGFRVGTASARGQTEPPEFDDYGEMFVDGFRMAALLLTYLLVFGFGGGIAGALASVAHEAAGVVVILVVFLGAAYLFPASLTAYAAHGTIKHALSPSHAGAFAATATYLKAYLLFVVVNVGVSILTTIAFVTIIGILAVPFIVAWSFYVDGALWGYYYREAVERDQVPPAPDEAV